MQNETRGLPESTITAIRNNKEMKLGDWGSRVFLSCTHVHHLLRFKPRCFLTPRSVHNSTRISGTGGLYVIGKHEMVKESYLQLLLKLVNRVLNALQNVPAQAGTLRAVHIVPGLHKPGHFTEFGATRRAQLRQHLAA